MSEPAESPPRRRNPRGQGERLREEIVAAAAVLLDEAGTAEAVTLRAVARRAGISAPSIYRHFADPPAILLAVAQEAFEELRRELAAASGSEPADPVARLVAVSHAYLSYAAQQPSRYRVMFGGAWVADPQRGGSVSEADVSALGMQALAVITAALDDCRTAGATTSTDPATDAVALWVGLHGLAHQRTVSPGFPWPAGLESRLVRSLAGLRPPS